ncbi:MAG: gliding motility-associated C-terminal domain-containing protein [Saprospiraceae bacterium]|nr:gliding motility-associated C-terminal domain-containing protein [Saprospiraceae bacterium]MCB9322235.1 gliding motility-associated C-terminal domain-containing protein [Lewinellaceae bacterium]
MEKKYLITLIIAGINLFLATGPLRAQTNEGTDFWFGFMQHRDNQNTKVVMITSKYNTTGTVSLPLENWSTSFSVIANTVTLVSLPNSAEVISSEEITFSGIRLTSGLPVSVYIHQYHNFRSEASVVLPVVSIGETYYVMSYNGVNIQGVDYPSEFLVVGTADETVLNITVSANTKLGKPAGTTFEVVLNQGETYLVQGAVGADDLTGSYVSADKPFALFGGNRWTEVPTGCSARDNLLEQMYPVSAWGRQFVTVPNIYMSYGIFRILASENNTNITVHSTSAVSYSLNAGEFVEFSRSQATYIEANHPVLVAQYLIGSGCNGHNSGDPSMVLLNSVEQTRDTITLYNSSFENISENYINVVMSTDDVPFVTLDGNVIGDNFLTQTIGLNDEFTYAKIPVSSGTHTIISEGCGVIATAYGYGEVESYAYSAGASYNTINVSKIPDGGCLGDTILFDTGLSPIRYSFLWDLGDGTTSTEAEFTHFYPELGGYPVSLILTNNCLNVSDTLYKDLLITLRQPVNTGDDVLICQGETIQLSATDIDGALYEWTGPEGYFSDQQFPIVENAQPGMSGDYAVIGIVSGCATFPAYTGVEVIPTPKPNLGPDTIYCNNNAQFTLDPGSYFSYEWQDGSVGSTYAVDLEGSYAVQVADVHGCIGEDSIMLRNICPTKIYVPNAFSPNHDGINDTFGVYGSDILSMKFTIFDRWGNLLFETTDQQEQWNGTFNGSALNSGTYVWQLEFQGIQKDGTLYDQVLSGEVYLLY